MLTRIQGFCKYSVNLHCVGIFRRKLKLFQVWEVAKTRWQDLFDDSGIKETEQLVVDLSKDFQELFKNIRSFSQATNQEIAKNIQIFKDFRAQLSVLNTSTDQSRDEISRIAQETLQLDQAQTRLKETQQAQVNIVSNLNKSHKSLREELAREKKALNEANIATKEGRQEAEKAARNIQKLSVETRDLQKATRGANSTLNAAKGSYNALQLETEQLRRRLRSLEGGIGNTSQEFRDLQERIAQNTQKLKDFDSEINQNFRNVGNYPDLLSQLKDSFGGVFAAGGPVAIGAVALAGLTAALKALGAEIIEFNGLLKQTQDITGQTGKQLQQTTAAIKTTADTFDQDFNEVLRAANAVSKEFGTSIDEVIDQIQIGFAAGADISGDFLDNLREYAPQLRQAGFSLEDFLKLNILTAKEGAFNDKLVDTIKEVNLRLGDLNKGQREALRSLGDVGVEIERLFVSGRQRDAILLLTKEISNLERQGKNTQPVLSNLFGAAGEDLGTRLVGIISQVDKFNIQLTASQKLTLESVKANEAYNQALADLGESFIGADTELSIFITNIKTNLLVVLNEVLEFFEGESGLANVIKNSFRNALGFITGGLSEIAIALGKFRVEVNNLADAVQSDFDVPIDTSGLDALNLLLDDINKKEAQLATEREFRAKEREKQLKKIQEEQKKVLDNVDVILRKEREGSIDLQEARNLIFESRKRQEELQTKIQEQESEKRIKNAEEEERRKQEIRQDFLSASFQATETIGNQIFTNNQIRRENELAALQEQFNADLELAGDNERAKMELQKQFDEERRRVQLEQAEAEKRRAIFNILISTAEGITKAIALSPLTFGLPFSAFVAAQGAIQLAAASSQPIPQFEEGTDGKTHKGLAIVNEQFKSKGSEVFKTNGKYYTLNTDGPALVNFDRPTEIIGYKDLENTGINPEETDFLYRKTTASLMNSSRSDSLNELRRELKDINGSIKNLSFGITVKGKKQGSYKMHQMTTLNIIQNA